jgi:hypothetical protein
MRSGAHLKGWAASVAAHTSAIGCLELHHCVPQCLLGLGDWADVHPELDGVGLTP